MAFMRPPSSNEIDEAVATKNRKNTLTLLKGITDQNIPGLSESSIMAWGQLGRYDLVESATFVRVQTLTDRPGLGMSTATSSISYYTSFSSIWVVITASFLRVLSTRYSRHALPPLCCPLTMLLTRLNNRL